MTSSIKNTPAKFRPALFAAALISLLAAPASRALADLAWQSSTAVTIKVGGGERQMETTTETMNLKNNVLRTDDTAGGSALIYNFQSRSSVMLDLRGRSFIALSLDDIIAEARKNIQDIKDDLPKREAQRQSMQGDGRDLMAAQIQAQRIKYDLWDPSHPYKVRPTLETAEVLGHQCRKYEGLSGETVFQEIWVTDDFPLDPAYHKYFEPNMDRIVPYTYTFLPQVSGFPIRVVSHYGPVTVTMDASNISTSPLPLEAFTIPDDFRQSPLVNQQP